MNQFEQGLHAVREGGCLVYPTETLYALGGDGRRSDVASRICLIKGRGPDKPLPLVVGAREQLALVADGESPEVALLAEKFWPGPLSIIVPSLPDLPPEVRDEKGRTSVRVTSHPMASKLCLETGAPLIATSANVGGKPPAFMPSQLDAGLCGQVDAVLDDAPWPGGGQASTVVSLEGGRRLRIHRRGAVAISDLMRAGFTVIGSM